jgi:cation diffusion facilitator family transporter
MAQAVDNRRRRFDICGMGHDPGPGIRLARIGLVVNGLLALGKLIAGLAGHSHALVADAIESLGDLFSGVIVWGGVRIGAREADSDHPFGHGKAEALAAAAVAVLLLGAAFWIAVGAVQAIMTPHRVPAPFTLVVLVGVVAVKELLFRLVLRGARRIGSQAIAADAWHHRSDAITSALAFLGISVALLGGPAWAAADDVAALLAAGIICYTGVRVLRPAIDELMDRVPEAQMVRLAESAARGVVGVLHVEKLRVRKAGPGYLIDLHAQADPRLSLHEAHVLSGQVKGAIRAALPRVTEVLVHMEPFDL